MSTSKWRDSTGLIDQLLDQPHRFEFFQAVRLLENWLGQQSAGRKAQLPSALRFKNSVSLTFPSSEIESLTVQRKPDEQAELQGTVTSPEDIERIEITTAFMGLLGVTGALPLMYTELFAQREAHDRDTSARGFLDVFSNRAVAMFYTAWKKSRLPLQYESDRNNRFAPMVLALAGLGQPSLLNRLKADEGGVNDESVAFFAGALQQRTLSASQLQQLLSRYLKVDVRVEQFCGRWYALPASARTCLGVGNGVLGRSALSGERVWQRDLRVRIVLGPLTHALFQRFLPGATGATALRELLSLLTGTSLEYEIKLVLQAAAVANSVLDSGRSSLAGRLGWDTYLQTHQAQSDRCDVCYDIHAEAA